MPDQFLRNLLMAPGTSGGEQVVQTVVREFAAQFSGATETDVHGNVSVTVTVPLVAPLPLLLTVIV